MNTYEIYFHGRIWAEVKTNLLPEVFREQMLRLFPIDATYEQVIEPKKAQS